MMSTFRNNQKLKFIKKNDFVIITAGLPFGKAGMTNMIRLYRLEHKWSKITLLMKFYQL